MVKLGIVEIFWHEVFLYSLWKILDKTIYSVTIFTTEDIYNNLKQIIDFDISTSNIYFKKKDESLKSFFNKVEHESKSLDIIFVNTLQGHTKDYPIYYLFKPKCKKKYLVVGRFNDWFGDKYRIKHFLKNDDHNFQHFWRKKILRSYDGVVVHSMEAKMYVEKYYLKNIFIIPFAINYWLKKSKDINLKKIVFGIPGGISYKRRDYESIIKIFGTLPDFYKNNCELILIGKPVGDYGRKIIMLAKYYNNLGCKIIYYTDMLDELTYINYINKCDILINPVQISNYIMGSYNASVVESVRFGIPFISPTNYHVLKDIQDLVIIYNNYNELYNIILKIIINPEILITLYDRNKIIADKFSCSMWSDTINKYLT